MGKLNFEGGISHDLEGREEESQEVSISLDFFRHDAKGKPSEGQPDETVRLSEEGRKHAVETGKHKDIDPEVALVYGSPRERSTETALRHLLANSEAVTDDMSLEDVQKLIGGKLKHGKKDLVTPNLNFDWTGTPKFKETALDRYTKKDGLNFLLEDSDQMVRDLHDEISTSYSRQAGNVAELIQKYLKILPAWKRIVERDPEKYQAHQNEMQRLFGSHQTVTETFLMKVIEKTDGKQAVKDFIAGLPDKNGFGLSEGYKVELKSTGDDVGVTLTYKDEHWVLSPELIEDIINDREVLNQEIESANE